MEWPAQLTAPSYAPLLFGAVAEGRFEHAFVPLTVEAGGHRGVFAVSQDALKVDGVRVNASAILQQSVADLIGASLLTPKLLDQMWAQRAITVLPCTQPITSSAAGMVAHSACVDRQIDKLGGIPPGGIAQTTCKTWVVSNALLRHPGRAENLGWYLEHPVAGVPFDPAPTLAGARMIQSPGFAHDGHHLDYSQCVLLVASACVVDGHPTTFSAVATDPNLAALVNHDGALRVLRQPGAPELVTPPAAAIKAPGKATLTLAATGAAFGAVVAGPPGALVGAAAGWAADAVRRKLLA